RLLVREFRKYLGAAYVLTSRAEDAARQFEALLRAEGERLESYQFDPGGAAFPSSVHEVFDAVRERLVTERRAQEEARAAAEAEREAQRREAVLALFAQAQEDEVEVENEEVLAWMPFGVGQFQNGDEDLGFFFAISESLLVTVAAGSLTAYLAYLEEYERALRFDPGSDPTNLENLLVGLTVLNWVSFGASVITMIAGVVEAVVGYVPRRTIRRQREVDPEILERLELVGAPGGLGLRLRF
ncbi:MAG: hypothetical protein R3266_12920, partial [Gemmatimonadota bacterium]|nr:hypothetical protein [Gemmatimonadota bacterium]